MRKTASDLFLEKIIKKSIKDVNREHPELPPLVWPDLEKLEEKERELREKGLPANRAKQYPEKEK